MSFDITHTNKLCGSVKMHCSAEEKLVLQAYLVHCLTGEEY